MRFPGRVGADVVGVARYFDRGLAVWRCGWLVWIMVRQAD